jgi:hypothetical protein
MFFYFPHLQQNPPSHHHHDGCPVKQFAMSVCHLFHFCPMMISIILGRGGKKDEREVSSWGMSMRAHPNARKGAGCWLDTELANTDKERSVVAMGGYYYCYSIQS